MRCADKVSMPIVAGAEAMRLTPLPGMSMFCSKNTFADPERQNKIPT